MYIHKLTIATYSTHRKLLIFLLCKIQSYSSGWQWSFITMVTNKQPLLYLPLTQCLLSPLPPSGRVMAVQWDGAATATGGEWIREWTEVGTGVSEKLFARWRRECVLVCTVGSAVGWHRAEGIQFTPKFSLLRVPSFSNHHHHHHHLLLLLLLLLLHFLHLPSISNAACLIGTTLCRSSCDGCFETVRTKCWSVDADWLR